VPATGSGIVNGVLDLSISQAVAGQSSGTVQGWVTSKLNGMGITSASATNIMYVLPGDVSFGGAAAYAYVNSYLSVYWNTYSDDLQVLVRM